MMLRRRASVIAAAAVVILALLAPADAQNACRPSDASSETCNCGFKTVSCAVLGLSRVPTNIPTDTETLILASNALTRVTGLSFLGLANLKKLNLRRNQLTSVLGLEASNLLKLEELDLRENLLTNLPTAIFSNFPALRTLRLDENLFTGFQPGFFQKLGQLRTLTMSRNQITAVDANMIAGNPELTELGLQVNNLTGIPGTFFNHSSKLRIIHLSMNPNLRLIPEGTWTPLTSLVSLTMYGNPSACLFEFGQLTCDCATGFADAGGSCEPRDCGTTITVPFATENCTGDTRFEGNNCPVTCNAGYNGGSQDYVCLADGSWGGNLKCTPKDCGPLLPNPHPNGSKTCSGDTTYTGDNCQASCNAGFEGEPKNYTCSTDGVWVPVTTDLECTPVECEEDIGGLAQHIAVDSCPDNQFTDTCDVQCLPGYEGGPATFTCNKDKDWDFTLTCTGVECGRNIKGLEHASAKCRNQTWFGGTPCLATCDPGYYPEGYGANVVEHFCDTDGLWKPTGLPMKCLRKDCGGTVPAALLPHPKAKSFCPNHLFGDKCEPGCSSGYTSTVKLQCGADGKWAATGTCTPISCGSTVNAVDPNLKRDCGNVTLFDGPKCTLECNPGYVGSQQFTCLADGRWFSSSPSSTVCFADCGSSIPDLDVQQIEYTCTGTVSPSGRCQARCREGFEPLGNPRYECSADGSWTGSFSCLNSQSSSALGEGGTVAVIAVVILLIALLVLAAFVIYRRRKRTERRHLEKTEAFSMTANPMQSTRSWRRSGKKKSARKNVPAPMNGFESNTFAMELNPLAAVSINESTTDQAFPAWAEAGSTGTIVSGFNIPVADA